MLFLAKFAAIVVVVWFYLTAQKQAEPPIKWAVIGLIGYLITWFLVKMTLVAMLLSPFAKSATMTVLVMQIPAVCAMVAAYFIRAKLVHDAMNNPKPQQPEVE